MTYTIDGSIDAADFNGFVDDLDDVYGVGFGDSGYGQSTFTLSNVVAGQSVGGDGGTAADEWGNFLNAAEVCRSHQGSPLIASQDETDYNNTGNNGTFVGGDGAGGTAYAALDTITLSDGSVITVDSVDGNGDVVTFTVTTTGGTTVTASVALTQSSTSGTGTAFTLTPESNNITDTNFPPLSEVSAVTPGTFVDAHESAGPTNNPFDIDSSIITLETRRLIADPLSTTLFTNSLQDSRNTAWSNQLLHIFTMTFATVDDARFFFNSGGEVRIRGARAGGTASTQNTDWTNLLIAMGTITMNFEETVSSGSATVASIGYFDLTTSFQQISTRAGTGAYTTNDATIFARTQDGPSGPNGDRGRILEFRVEYNDDHSNVFADSVDGTITSDVDILKATASLTIEPIVPSTILATTTALSAGS